MSRPLWLDPIEQEAGGKPVVLLEGQDDEVMLGHFLSQHSSGWERRLHLAAAGSKRRVVRGVTVHRPDWLGIIDCDEWSPADVEDACAQSDRLLILPRFCLESYFCVPEELWEALPEVQRQRVGDAIEKLADPIWEALSDWVAHGAMWRVLHDRWQDLRFPAELENQPVTDEARIRDILQTWHDGLKPDVILDAYRNALQSARSDLTAERQLKSYVHAKKFFNQIVVQQLDQLFSGRGRGDWLQKFRDGGIQPPPDLSALFDEMWRLL